VWLLAVVSHSWCTSSQQGRLITIVTRREKSSISETEFSSFSKQPTRAGTMAATTWTLERLTAAGADVEALRSSCSDKAALHEQLKALGVAKLGDRLRVAELLQRKAPTPAPAAPPPTAPPPPAAAPGGWSVALEGMDDLVGDGGVLKRVRREGAAGGGRPPVPSRVKLRWVGRLASLHGCGQGGV
jgi:hypothetical protein